MTKNLLKALMMVPFISTLAYSSCNHGLLGSESEIYVTKMWSGAPIREASIETSLRFYQPEGTEGDEVSNFERYYQSFLAQITDDRFVPFANSCKHIHDTRDPQSKAAVTILFKEVAEKFLRLFRQHQRLREIHQEEERKESARTDDAILGFFLNADRPYPSSVTSASGHGRLIKG